VRERDCVCVCVCVCVEMIDVGEAVPRQVVCVSEREREKVCVCVCVCADDRRR